MNLKTECGTVLRKETAGLIKTGRRPQILLLSVALALMLATVVSAQSYRVLKTFSGSDGAQPYAELVMAGNTFYGVTYQGGSSNFGVVYRVNMDGSGYSVLKSFTGGDGQEPIGGLVLAGGILYGTTSWGGNLNSGVVFKISTNGSDYAVLKNFAGSDGEDPVAGLVLSERTLYGTAYCGGSYGCGVVFKVNIDGSGFEVLKNFTGGDGEVPIAGLVLSRGTLYGTTYSGGSFGYGVVFKVNTDGSGFEVLKQFTPIDARDVQGNLLLSDSTLYGTTCHGGSSDCGVIFKLNIDGSGFALLKSFSGDDGACPIAGLLLVGSTLYGTTALGGSSGRGVIFQIKTNGSGYTLLKSFSGSDGHEAYARLVLADGAFYGTTRLGGHFDLGTVFSFALAPSVKRSPLTQTAEVGTTVQLHVEVESPSPALAYQWFFDGSIALVCATNSSLELTNVQLDDAGTYTVVITNSVGAVTSAPAVLSVIAPVEKRIVPAIHLAGGAGSLIHVEHADSLDAVAPHWFALSDVTLGGDPQFCFDLGQPLPMQRFYRAWQASGPQPVLDATMATQIQLAGTVGSQLHIDYINQFGPIDAWVTLATVTLTNTAQFYYDLTAFRQPSRLYRLVALP